MPCGTLTIDRFNGQEQFNISSAIICLLSSDGEEAEISFGIETEGPPLKTCPDTVEFEVHPNADFVVQNCSLEKLQVGMRFQILAYDEESETHLTRLYYCEHEDVEDCVLEILDKKDDAYRIKISGTSVDVNYYDGSKPPAKILVEAWFAIYKKTEDNLE